MSASALRVALVGFGRMGRLVDALAAEYGATIVARIHSRYGDIASAFAGGVDVAIDFSTAEALVKNFPVLAEQKVAIVVGTTGWQKHEEDLRRKAEAAGLGVVASANFSPGLIRFRSIVEHAAAMFAGAGYGAWIHEAHHSAKRDAPSGTALMLKSAMAGRGYTDPIDVSSTRAGAIPGTHTVGFDHASETITLTHSVRDRSTFARGALMAARWVHGKHGWYSMNDVLGIS